MDAPDVCLTFGISSCVTFHDFHYCAFCFSCFTFYLLLFIIIFVISKIVISFIGKSLNIFAKLPVIKTANKTLGAAFGFSKGVVIALTLCYSLIIITNIYKDGIMGITSQTVSESFIFGSIIKLF